MKSLSLKRRDEAHHYEMFQDPGHTNIHYAVQDHTPEMNRLEGKKKKKRREEL
jgi:hypothetical protein